MGERGETELVPTVEPRARSATELATPVATATTPPAATIARAARRGRFDPAGALALQRTAGNAAVVRILARAPPEPPRKLDDDNDWDQWARDQAKLGAELGVKMIDTLEGRDSVLFMSRLRALSVAERIALNDDAEFWKKLRTHLSGLALWAVQLFFAYPGKRPSGVNELSAAIHAGDHHRTRTLLMGYDSLRSVVGLREVISSRFHQREADDLRAVLAETGTRAESGMTHYKEAHYEQGVLKRFTGDRNFELVRLNNQVRVIVRINLSEDAANKKTEITDEIVSNWESGIGKRWNNKFRLRLGTQGLDVWFLPIFVYHDDKAHHQVKVMGGAGRADETDWFASHEEGAGDVAAHEFGHMLGNPDEYRLPGSMAEIPAALGLTAAEQKRSSWEGVTGNKLPTDTAGHSVSALMGSHYLSTSVHVRYLRARHGSMSRFAWGWIV